MLNLIKMERYQLFRNRIYQISTLAVFVLGFLWIPILLSPWGIRAASQKP